MEVFSLAQKPARTPDEAMQKSYEFWNTQPVPKMGTTSFSQLILSFVVTFILIFLFYL